jgi:hypothetical protein
MRTGKNRGAAVAFGDTAFAASLRIRDDLEALRPFSCESAHRRLDASKSFPSANASAVRPLARHSRTRSAHVSRVSFVIPARMQPPCSIRKYASSYSGYPWTYREARARSFSLNALA